MIGWARKGEERLVVSTTDHMIKRQEHIYLAQMRVSFNATDDAVGKSTNNPRARLDAQNDITKFN